MLISWLSDNDTSDWSHGTQVCAVPKEHQLPFRNQTIPIQSTLGVEARVGLRSTALPEEVLKTMIIEKDLLGAYSFPSDSTRPDHSPECINPPDDSPECMIHPDDSPECSTPPND
ncbi:hypothetical protein Pmani_036741 [Petrolisthes manimaculis]|uniref:Uncharacterized protein n=1 Tax=Petrolisthes manimaculis TaxID=1843537 RepID=A0AAE1NI65_9EUCA|nr:hypothetical protein Pmani_036741 [Petrolisthes manimaculis]